MCPRVATFGLRKVATEAEPDFGQDVCGFVERNFYVDDGLTSLLTPEAATDMIRRTQEALMTHGNLRLHKIASNKPSVMLSLSSADLAKDLVDLDFEHEELPAQRSLGLF